MSMVHRIYIARTLLVFAPFLPYPSWPPLAFPGTTYFLTLSCMRCNNWHVLPLEKWVMKNMISYITMLWYTKMQISANILSHSCLMIACRLHTFKKWLWLMSILMRKHTWQNGEKAKHQVHWFTLCDFSTMKLCCGYFVWDSLPSRRFWVIFNKPVSRKRTQFEESNTRVYLCLAFSTFDPSQCQQKKVLII